MKRKPTEQNPVKMKTNERQDDVQVLSPYSGVEYAWGIAYSSGTVMGRYLKEEFDHTKTSLPHPMEWPLALKIMMSQCLTNQSAIAICWGPDLNLLYNDNYQTILDQSKQLSSFGRPTKDIFPEIWDQVKPMFASVFQGIVMQIKTQ